MQLSQMRLRIKAIETIKKITNAMRLISMSMHIRLSHKVPLMQNYKSELLSVLNMLQSYVGPNNNILNPPHDTPKKTLVIVIGSQKGLSGTFNSALFKFLEKHENLDNKSFIAVGKKTVDYLKKTLPRRSFSEGRETELDHSYNIFNFQNLENITNDIYNIITSSKTIYTNIICYSNYSKGFLLQLPQQTVLVPLQTQKTETSQININIQDYIWQQEPKEILDILTREYLKLTIQSLLFESLIAEQAARFQSMDNATRNANELLENMKRQYNKLRQTKITKEISEISGNL